jgi:hypothetical protein
LGSIRETPDRRFAAPRAAKAVREGLKSEATMIGIPGEMKLWRVVHPDCTGEFDERSADDTRPAFRIVSADTPEMAAIVAGMVGGKVELLNIPNGRGIITSFDMRDDPDNLSVDFEDDEDEDEE